MIFSWKLVNWMIFYLTHTQQTKNINLIFVYFKMGGYVNISTWNYKKITVAQIKTFTIDQILLKINYAVSYMEHERRSDAFHFNMELHYHK